MKFVEALKNLQHKRENKFVLSGNEPFLKDQFVSAAKKFHPSLVFFPFYRDSETEAISALSSISLFEGDRMVVLYGADRMDKAAVAEAIKDFSEGVAILVLTEAADGRTKAVSNLISSGTQVECNAMRTYGDDYPRWIAAMCSEAGYELRDGAEAIIYALVGPSMYALYHEMQKLFVYKSESKIILPEDARKVVSHRFSNSAYDILDNILNRDTAATLRAFSSYCREHDSLVELTAFLGSYFEKLYRLAALRETGMPANSIGDIVDIPKFLIRTKYLPKVATLGRAWISDCMAQVVDLDVGIRLHKAKRTVVERFLMSVSST